MSKPLPPIIAYELEFKPGIAQVDGSREWGLEYIHIHAHHAGGEPLKMFYENDGLWLEKLTAVLGAPEALAVMTQLEMGESAKVPGTFTRDTLEALRFHPDLLKIA